MTAVLDEAGTDDPFEFAARAFEAPRRRWATPGDFAAALLPATRRTPALDLIDEALVELMDTPNDRLIITMPPQEGKSTRVAKDFVAWALTQQPDWRVIGASYGQRLANRNGRSVRRLVERDEVPLTVAPDNGAAHEWSLAGHEGGLYSVGIGGGVTGQACDLMIIDDPIKSRAEAESKLQRDKVWDWWTDEASARFGATTRCVLILTRWHHDDLAGRLLAEPGSPWRVLNIPAQADHDPEAGETDPLGREVGEFMDSARKRTTEQWELRKRTVGSRTWSSQYQGRPTPETGNLFPVEDWARYTRPLWVTRADGARVVPEANGDPNCEIIQSWDFAFKDNEGSDFVVGTVWMRKGTKVYLLDMVRERAGFRRSVQMIKEMTARWPQATAKLVEDKANGPAILNALRNRVGGLIPVEPEGSKYARAEAITPLVEAGDVVLPDPMLAPWVITLTDEARDFPDSKNDDTVDSMSQAVHRLLLVPILSGEVYNETDLMPDLEELDWSSELY